MNGATVRTGVEPGGLRGWAGLLAVALVLAGAESGRGQWLPAGPKPAVPARLNVYRAAPTLPADLRRVVLLPLHVELPDLGPEMQQGLLDALQTELLRSGFAEVVLLPARRLQKLTGRPSWSPEQPLPPDFLQKVREASDAEAVLFAELTTFRPYTPAVVGWRLRLVDLRSGCTWWAADEVFDTADPVVIRAARRSTRTGWWNAGQEDACWRSLRAPRALARLTVSWLLATLPGRENSG